MNGKVIVRHVGKVVGLEALLLLLCMAVAAVYREPLLPFMDAAIIAALLFGLSCLISKGEKDSISGRDGCCIVTFSWLLMSAIGALPFVISGEIPHFVDALFETVSGFTTTGASVVTDVEAMSHGILFWRSLTHWLGGMGILVFILALGEKTPERSMNLLRAEMAGPSVDKIRPKAKGTARSLYYIYLGMTVALFLLLIVFRMPVFDSAVHALGTAGTGGFGIKADSVGSYSPAIQWIIGIFMMLFGINFNLYYLILSGKGRTVLKSNELACYLGIIGAVTLIISYNIRNIYGGWGDSLRYAFFQVSSIVTTTGFATDDFNLWPELSRALLLLLMFLGGCAGSTAGGLKISRLVVLFQNMKVELRKNLKLHAVTRVRLNGKVLEQEEANAISHYFVTYIFTIGAVFLLISPDAMGLETNISAAISCVNNIGPALGAAGPASSYAAYSIWSKLVLTGAMLLGRLEIYPVLIAFFGKTN